ncbi:hypothetical protein V6N13_072199 [Hibiscus sabdariffa]
MVSSSAFGRALFCLLLVWDGWTALVKTSPRIGFASFPCRGIWSWYGNNCSRGWCWGGRENRSGWGRCGRGWAKCQQVVAGRLPIEHVIFIVGRKVNFFCGPLLGRDWAGAEGDGAGLLGVDPRGVSAVLLLVCSAGAAGVVAGLVVVVWLETGMTGGEGSGV